MSRGPRRVALIVTLAAALPANGVRADTQVVGGCPGLAALRRFLTPLLPAGEAGSAAVSIADQGSNYRIVVGEQATTLDDPARDCEARARQAAAIVASQLHSHPQVFGPPMWTLEKGVVFDVAPTAEGGVWAPGAELRGAYGSGRWSLFGAAGARGPATLVFDNVWKAELLRFPLDAGARLTVHWWRLRLWLGLGPSLTLTGIMGENLLETDREWRFDPGVLTMAGATLPITKRIGVGAAINIRWQPRPYHLQVAPVGQVGETPRWWFGLSLSYTIDGKPTSF
jgi:hypothetical protein